MWRLPNTAIIEALRQIGVVPLQHLSLKRATTQADLTLQKVRTQKCTRSAMPNLEDPMKTRLLALAAVGEPHHPTQGVG